MKLKVLWPGETAVIYTSRKDLHSAVRLRAKKVARDLEKRLEQGWQLTGENPDREDYHDRFCDLYAQYDLLQRCING